MAKGKFLPRFKSTGPGLCQAGHVIERRLAAPGRGTPECGNKLGNQTRITGSKKDSRQFVANGVKLSFREFQKPLKSIRALELFIDQHSRCQGQTLVIGGMV